MKSEKGVKSVLDAFEGYINPFTIAVKEELFCLSSGAAASKEISNDLLDAMKLCSSAMENFIEKGGA